MDRLFIVNSFPVRFCELTTVEPPNKGQLGTGHFVPCSEVGLS